MWIDLVHRYLIRVVFTRSYLILCIQSGSRQPDAAGSASRTYQSHNCQSRRESIGAPATTTLSTPANPLPCASV